MAVFEEASASQSQPADLRVAAPSFPWLQSIIVGLLCATLAQRQPLVIVQRDFVVEAPE